MGILLGMHLDLLGNSGSVGYLYFILFYITEGQSLAADPPVDWQSC